MRAVLALLLMAGFYLLALAVIAGLVLILYLEVTSRTINAFLTIVAFLGIYTIVSGIVPRRRKFIEPGPRVTPEDQPELFDVIHHVAEATGGPRPQDVYVVADVNAGVAHVGGLAGIGCRPVMLLGLPLIGSLTVSELRGVIAHEFGHFVGGETKLAPVIYRTREAIGRTVMGLAASGHWFTRLLHLPFHWYGRMYLSTTQGISRRQELDADAMAARISGGTSMESALVKTHHAALAWGRT
jgi:heat shock protein HtpX